jgi:endoglucanase
LDRIADILAALCRVEGVSGAEDAAAEAASIFLEQSSAVQTDRLGNVLGFRTGGQTGGPRILLDAHLDQIGLIVTAVTEEGFLRVGACGHMDARVLAAQEVIVHGSQPLLGVISSVPPHLAKGDESACPDIRDLCVDIGFSGERAAALVPLGSRVTLLTDPMRLAARRFTGAALDNRAGVAAILRCLEFLDGEATCPLTVLFSAQEETGGSGAAAAGFSMAPDEAIAVDVSFGQAPGLAPEEAAPLGCGTLIGWSPVLSRDLSLRLEELAQTERIPFRREVMGGRTGTNADRLQVAGTGIPCGLLSIPLRNMHTGIEVLDLADSEATAKLLAAYVRDKSRR